MVHHLPDTSLSAYISSARQSRKLVLVIVAIALLLDNMLLTTVGKKGFRMKTCEVPLPFICVFKVFLVLFYW